MEPTNGKSSVRLINVLHTIKMPEYHTPQMAAEMRRDMNAEHEAAEQEIAKLLDQGYEVVNMAASEYMVHVMLVKQVNRFAGATTFGEPLEKVDIE